MLPKLKIVNATDFYGPDLRRFVRAGMRASGLKQRKRVTFRYPRPRERCLGYGEYGLRQAGGLIEGAEIDLLLPREGPADLRQLGATFEHEALHNLGFRHRDMACPRHDSRYQPKWVAALVLRRKGEARPRPARPEPTRADLVGRKLDHAREALGRHERRMRLLKTLAGKWRRRVRYYEKRLAADREASRG